MMKSRVCALIASVALASLLGVTDVNAQSAPKVAATAPASKNAAPITDTKRFAENAGSSGRARSSEAR